MKSNIIMFKCRLSISFLAFIVSHARVVFHSLFLSVGCNFDRIHYCAFSKNFAQKTTQTFILIAGARAGFFRVGLKKLLFFDTVLLIRAHAVFLILNINFQVVTV